MRDLDLSEMSEEQILELAQTFEDPVVFCELYLGFQMWGRQAQIAYSVDRNKNTAVKACHGSGKTAVAGKLTHAWLQKYAPEALVITTAPTWNQVENLLWGEVRDSCEYARQFKTLALPKPNATELKISNKHYAIGISTNEGVRFQGFHNKNILIILDEAPGISPKIMEAIEGIRSAGNVHLLMLGNPVVPSGHFYDAFNHPLESRRWNKITISAFDTPNFRRYPNIEALKLAGDEGRISSKDYPAPYLITPEWVYERLGIWRTNNPNWASRVMGDFPEQSDMAIFPAAWVYEAQKDPLLLQYGEIDKTAYLDRGNRMFAGIDVAGPGEDETTMYVRLGPHIIDFWATADRDPRAECAKKLAPYKPFLNRVTVDTNGSGYYFGLYLMDLGYPVVPTNFGESAINGDRFVNLKAEMYWLLREWLEGGQITGLTDQDTQSQLTQILYEERNGKVRIETKDEARKRGVKSPDRAEALVLCYSDVLTEVQEDVVTDEEDDAFAGVSRY